MTRVVAGVARGRRLEVPGGPTRPTADRVREALFSALQSAVGVADAHVLDLYAGSGALGLEALSRGAAGALLVESDRRAARIIRRNEAALGLPGAHLRCAAVETVLRERSGPVAPDAVRYGIVFADPPYAVSDTDLGRVLALLVDRGWLSPDATVVVERSAASEPPPWPRGMVALRVKRYGDTALHWATVEALGGRGPNTVG